MDGENLLVDHPNANTNKCGNNKLPHVITKLSMLA